MAWFDDQIRQRMENDQNELEESYYRLASVVMDKWNADRLEDQRLVSKAVYDDILKYYHQKPVDIPESIQDTKEQLEYVLRSSGLMTRDVELEENWQKTAFGPMLGRNRETGDIVALLPGTLSGYYYRDTDTGRKIRVTRKNAGQFSRDAICFYQPLPMKKLGMSDLLFYMKQSISTGDLVLFIAAAVAVQLVCMIEPMVYSLITGPILEGHYMNLMTGLAVFLVCSAFASQMISVVRTLLMKRIGTKASVAVESSVMMRILSLPVSFFREHSSGELASRAGCVSSLCDMITESIFSVGLSSLLSLLYVAQIFQFAPALVVPSILLVLATVVISVTSSLLQIGISRRRMELEAREKSMTYAALNGIQKIRLSGSEKRVFARWAGLYSRKARMIYNQPMFLKISTVITTAISLAGTIVLYYVAVRTGVSESQYYAFSAAYGRLVGAFTALVGVAGTVASIKPVLDMAEPILRAEPEVAADKRPIEQVSGQIEINNVSFRYSEDTPYIMNDLSLSIQAGEYVAIVGRTGCGKSTLVRLLLGFENPEQGTILYDEYRLNSVDPRSLRKHIGVVTQNGELIRGDIYSNITFSAPELSMDEVWEAAETAGIAQDIREMPMGMNTVISEGQGGISGGQKQRLMIARAIAPKPKILIFDEATSALDNKTQKQISDALDKLNCTRIVIAHRLSTIRNCSRILVMHDGAIVEEGRYEELVARNGYFAELVERQRLDA